MITRRSWFVYGTLLAIWLLLMGWQAVEHNRVKTSAQAELINRAKDISNTLGLLLRSQRLFGVITKERLESALNELVKPGELHSVVLLNATNEIVASAGAPIDLQARSELRGGQRWDDQTVMLENLVDLGTNVTQELERTNVTIVMPASELFNSFQTNRPPPPRFEGDHPPPPRFEPEEAGTGTNTNAARRRGGGGWRRRGTNDFNSFERPHWMKEEDYRSIIQKKGVHSFIIVMSTKAIQAQTWHDLWMRSFIGVLAAVSVVGSGLAWRNLAKNAELQIRLVRASELNSHLREMNLAAAGLAHETRNPLNIIRGLAQMISKQQDATVEVRSKSREIIDEADRVAAQLNEFINYSRPREVRRSPTNLNSVIAEVVRALNYDIEEKQVRLQVEAEPLTVEADEQLLRQALFNLVINAIQAVPEQGRIWIRANRAANAEAVIEIADDGPGVAPEHRAEIFKPYFTMQQKGTGLGLAVVQQIVLAHGWEVECLGNEPKGAIFRLTHAKLSGKSS